MAQSIIQTNKNRYGLSQSYKITFLTAFFYMYCHCTDKHENIQTFLKSLCFTVVELVIETKTKAHCAEPNHYFWTQFLYGYFLCTQWLGKMTHKNGLVLRLQRGKKGERGFKFISGDVRGFVCLLVCALQLPAEQDNNIQLNCRSLS